MKTMITLARNRVNDRDRDVSTEETARILSSLIGLPALAEKDMSRRTYSVCGFFVKQSIRGRLDIETSFTRQILEIPTD